MEEATTKPSEVEIKFNKVHAYLSKGEYPPCASKSQKLVIRRRAKGYQLVDGQVHYVGHMKGCEGDPTKRVSYFKLDMDKPTVV